MTTMTPTRAFRPDYAVPPGTTIAELLDDHGMTQTELAARLGVYVKHVNQIVNAGTSVSAELALGLEKVFSTPAAFWINREANYRADLARQGEEHALEEAVDWAKRFPIPELKKRGLISSPAKGTELVRQLLGFLGLASADLWAEPMVVYRKSRAHQSDPYALAAWLRAGELKGAEINCAPYDEHRFLSALAEIRSLTPLSPGQWQPRLRELCAQAGVAVVIVDTFKGARANGSTRWLSPSKALIQLSLRYKTDDHLWFTFFHEAGHILLHGKQTLPIADLLQFFGLELNLHCRVCDMEVIDS